MDPSSKLREASGLLRRKFLIDEKVKRFETFYTTSFYYPYLLNASDCIYAGTLLANYLVAMPLGCMAVEVQARRGGLSPSRHVTD